MVIDSFKVSSGGDPAPASPSPDPIVIALEQSVNSGVPMSVAADFSGSRLRVRLNNHATILELLSGGRLYVVLMTDAELSAAQKVGIIPCR